MCHLLTRALVSLIASRTLSPFFSHGAIFSCAPQLKKDKERLQAMMAHLKSSEPKAAAQPVSTRYDSLN